MKIREKTPQRLVIIGRPSWLAALLVFFGISCIVQVVTGNIDGTLNTALFIGMGVILLWYAHYSMPLQKLTFDRTTGKLTREVKRLTGQSVVTIPRSDIRRAVLQPSMGSGSKLERLTLLIGDDLHPMEYGFTSNKRGALVERVNLWLEGKQEEP